MNLVIGNTSQQSYYYPVDYLRISSRNINFEVLKSSNFDSIYLTFAEQRIYEENIDYMGVNFNYTLNIINNLIDTCNKIVIFTSCEMWSNLKGGINLKTSPNFNLDNSYTVSKYILFKEILRLRNIDDRFNKVKIIHPFYFNSVYRSKYFLFGKIFDSIINKKYIEVGNLDFYRDMIDTKFMVDKVIETKEDLMMGSGKLFNVRNFIIDLYSQFNMKYSEFVTENLSMKPDDKVIRANVNWSYTYDDLVENTVADIKTIIQK